MIKEITGRCKCGAITYTGQRADAATFRCYCRDCQQLTGTGHADMLPLNAATFSITPERREYEMQGGSGRSTWAGFCPNCGSPLTRRSAQMSDRIYVHAGSLDDPSLYHPDNFIHTAAAQPWDSPTD